METIKKLKDAAEECIRDLKSIDSKISVSEGRLEFLQAKVIGLNTEIADLETKKAAVMDAVGTFEKDARNKIEDRLREIRAKEESLTADRADVKTKIFQADAAKADSDQAKEKYSALYAEYLTKVAEIDEKRQALANVLK